jgi:outer membrane scaffolding protein for murein synthesis (MipA/OmpV family)
VVLASLLCAAAAGADQKPLWELGLGTGVLIFNDYRGSSTTHAYLLPVPYFVYRGELLKSDDKGLRGLFVHHERLELELSVNATTPVRNDSVRSGMPDLRPTLEIGPQLDAHLWRSDDRRVQLDLRVPVRAALTAQAVPHMVGVYLAPNLSLDIAQHPGSDGWKLGLLAGPLFADHRYDSYFYSVAPQYATAARPAYDAPGGYAGTQALIALTRRYSSWWLGAYVRHDTLGGASFADSPLVKRDSYWTGGVGVVWILRQSTQRVESEE